MNIIISFFLLILLANNIEPHGNLKKSQIIFYVSTHGNNNWSGKLSKPNIAKTDGPFATLKKARDAIRNLKRMGDIIDSVIVYLKGGDYYLQKKHLRWTN